MTFEIQKIANLATSILLPLPNGKDEATTIGIAFSNAELPVRLLELLERSDRKFTITLKEIMPLLHIELSQKENKVLYAELNYDKNEFDVFKKYASFQTGGVLVFGAMSGCSFRLWGNPATYKPLLLEQLIFLD